MKTWIVKTVNSVYHVEQLEVGYQIEKTEATNPDSRWFSVGQKFVSNHFSARVGESAFFDAARTSEVVSVEEVPC